MNFYREKQSRQYFLFLLLYAVMLCCFMGWMYVRYEKMGKKLLLSNNQKIAASLLSQGVDKTVAALALTNTEKSEKGNELLHQIGYTEQTQVIFFPTIMEGRKNDILVLLCITVLWIILLFGPALHFLEKRDKLYRKAVRVIKQYEAGDFSCRLHFNGEGALFQLFTMTNRLATALKAKGEDEQHAKEFLKDTVSDISHQMKTPLAALRMYNEIITEEPENRIIVQEFSEKSSYALERMEQLIQSLLKMMRLDAGSITFEKRICKVYELVRRALKDLETRALREGKQINIDGKQSEEIYCDLDWTSEAVGNLVKNALDHTNHLGVIRISWESSQTMLRLTVSDDGRGIHPDDIHHIFKRFYRSKYASDKQGCGLGLPLSKAILSGQGFVLSVASSYGKGTTFSVSFLTEV